MSDLVDVKHIAQQIGCCHQTVYRMSWAGKMPPPIRVGTLLRWPRKTIDSWVDSGCPPEEEREVSEEATATA